MEKEMKIDVNLINTCHGCLSSDRTLSPLGNKADMLVNVVGNYGQCLVYVSILSHWSKSILIQYGVDRLSFLSISGHRRYKNLLGMCSDVEKVQIIPKTSQVSPSRPHEDAL